MPNCVNYYTGWFNNEESKEYTTVPPSADKSDSRP